MKDEYDSFGNKIDRTDYWQFFLHQIGVYNEKKEHFLDHYINLGNGRVMRLFFDEKWHYSIHTLENPNGDRNEITRWL